MHRISVQLFLQATIVMVMTFLWYNKSVCMDFRLTLCFYTTLCWSSDKLCLKLHCSYWFYFLTWRFSGPSLVKLFQKVKTPSRYIESRYLTTQKTNHFSINKVAKFETFLLRVLSLDIQGFFIVVFMLILFYYVSPVMFMTLLTVPLAALSLNWLLSVFGFMYSKMPALTHHAISDCFFYLFLHRS